MPCFSLGCCCVQIERLSFLYVHLFTHISATSKFAICSDITSWQWETGWRWKMRRHSSVNNLASACSARGSTQLLVVHSWRRGRWSQTHPGAKVGAQRVSYIKKQQPLRGQDMKQTDLQAQRRIQMAVCSYGSVCLSSARVSIQYFSTSSEKFNVCFSIVEEETHKPADLPCLIYKLYFYGDIPTGSYLSGHKFTYKNKSSSILLTRFKKSVVNIHGCV